MTTLFDATLALAKCLGDVRNSTLTANGTATTLVDTTRTEADDYWNEGTVWLTSGTHSGKSRKITDFVQSTGTLTIPTLGSAAASGNSYTLAAGWWPQDKLIEFVNSALYRFGGMPTADTTLTTVANQEAYTLPTGIANVKRVELAMSTTSPYSYVPHYGWREMAGSIYFDPGREPDTAGYTLRLWYDARHATLASDTDTINAAINLDRLAWEAAVLAWEWRQQMSAPDNREIRDRLAFAVAQVGQLRSLHPTRSPMAKAPRLTL